MQRKRIASRSGCRAVLTPRRERRRYAINHPTGTPSARSFSPASLLCLSPLKAQSGKKCRCAAHVQKRKMSTMRYCPTAPRHAFSPVHRPLYLLFAAHLPAAPLTASTLPTPDGFSSAHQPTRSHPLFLYLLFFDSPLLLSLFSLSFCDVHFSLFDTLSPIAQPCPPERWFSQERAIDIMAAYAAILLMPR